MKTARKFTKCCLKQLENSDFEDGVAKKVSFCWFHSRKARALLIREVLFQWFVDLRSSLKTRLLKALFFYKLRNFVQIGCSSIHMHLRKNSSSSKTNESRTGNLNMESLCDTQINVIQFQKKAVPLEYKIT